MSEKKEILVHEGAVALFDVLGYQELLLKNTIKDVVSLVRENLEELPSTIEAIVQDHLQIDPKKFSRDWLRDFQWMIFSDTILLALDFPSVSYPLPHQGFLQRAIPMSNQRLMAFMTGSQWIVFLNVCAVLMRQLFIKGLPLRGAIHFGEYYVNKHCFVGSPIVSAHRDASKQTWSGCTVDETIRKHYRRVLRLTGADKPTARQILVDYPVPTRRKGNEIRSAVNWVRLPGSQLVTKIKAEPLDFVRDSFLAHGKTLTKEVEHKLENTAAFVNYVSSRRYFPLGKYEGDRVKK